MLEPSTLAFLLALVSGTAGTEASRGSIDSLIVLRGYDRLAIVDIRLPTQAVNEWKLPDSARDITAVASSPSALLVLSHSPRENLPCLHMLSLFGSSVDRVACGRILAISVDALSEMGFLLERQSESPSLVQVLAVDLRARRPLRRVLRYRAELPATSLSVADRGERIVLESGGFLFDVEGRSGNLRRMAAGTGPSLSPDGSRLAFLRDGDLYVYDYEKRIARRILDRRFWQTRLVGPVSWSPGGKLLSIPAPAGIAGKHLECIVVNEAGQISTSFGSGTSWCGPWIWERR